MMLVYYNIKVCWWIEMTELKRWIFCCLFFYSLRSAESITVAFEQTQTGNSVREPHFHTKNEKLGLKVDAHQSEEPGQCALVPASPDWGLCALGTWRRGLEKDAVSAKVTAWNWTLKVVSVTLLHLWASGTAGLWEKENIELMLKGFWKEEDNSYSCKKNQMKVEDPSTQ